MNRQQDQQVDKFILFEQHGQTTAGNIQARACMPNPPTDLGEFPSWDVMPVEDRIQAMMDRMLEIIHCKVNKKETPNDLSDNNASDPV